MLSLRKFKNSVWTSKHTKPNAERGIGVLHFFSYQQGEVYPSDIVDKMKGANLNILEGTLYPLLTRLKNAGYLTYRWVESNSGPPRKYFSMTDSGLLFYSELERTWNELADAVQKLTSLDAKEEHLEIPQQ